MTRVREKDKKVNIDKVFDVFNFIILTVLLFVVLYPVVYVVSCSISSGTAVSAGKVLLFPVDISFSAYEKVFSYDDIWIGYKNTIIYTVLYVTLGLTLTILAAYPLSKKELPLRRGFNLLFAFTMWFSGGLIPSYLLIKDLHLLDSIGAIILPGALGAYNIMILRTFFETGIPVELSDSAKIDGCSEWKYLLKIVLPLSKATLVVLALFYAVGMWNSYMGPFLYLNTRSKYPLQIVLREILVVNQMSDLTEMNNSLNFMTAVQRAEMMKVYEVIKYAVIVLSSLPLVIAYPFLQRYFAKGMLVGAIKG